MSKPKPKPSDELAVRPDKVVKRGPDVYRRHRARHVGGQTKFRVPILRKVLLSIQAGNYRRVAAEAAGIAPNTLAGWLQQGKKEADEELETKMANFYRELVELEAAVEAGLVGTVVREGQTDAKIALEYLSRKRPDEWGRKERLPAETDQQQIVLVINNPAQIEA